MTTLTQRFSLFVGKHLLLLWRVLVSIYGRLSERLSFLRRDAIVWFLKIFFGIPLRLFFHIQSEGKKPFPPPGQPAFVIGNHANILDPIIASSFVQRPICYVVANHSLGSKISRSFLKWIKAIPKTKNMPDSETMRQLLKLVKQGQIIGIAPEGGRNWDGETIDINETIPRLVRKLRLPVICIRVKGGFLSWPRWSNWPRRGRMILEFNYLFEDPSLIPEDEGEIQRMIAEKMRYSELEDERITRHSYNRHNCAEFLELRLWLCPHCHQFFSLRSHGKHLSCRKCGARWMFTGNGRFILESKGNNLSPQTRNFLAYLEWARYNDSQTMSLLEDEKNKGKEYLVTVPARMWSVPIDKQKPKIYDFDGKGVMKLTRDFRMVFIRSHDREILLDAPLTFLKGTHVIWNHKLEFFLNGKVYRFTFYGNSAYFWHFLAKQLAFQV